MVALAISLRYNKADQPAQGQPMKVRDVIKRLEDDGWEVVRMRGSHRQYKHPTKTGLVTVAGKLGADMAPGTLANILRQAQLKGTTD